MYFEHKKRIRNGSGTEKVMQEISTGNVLRSPFVALYEPARPASILSFSCGNVIIPKINKTKIIHRFVRSSSRQGYQITFPLAATAVSL